MTLEQKLDTLAAYVLAEDAESREVARKALTASMRATEKHEIQATTDAEEIVHQYLLELGAQPHLLGYRYAVYGILEAVMNPDVVDNICSRFYPGIAMKFNTTAARADRAIRNLIEQTWTYGDTDKQFQYFKSGKPTNSEFVARSALVIRSRLKK